MIHFFFKTKIEKSVTFLYPPYTKKVAQSLGILKSGKTGDKKRKASASSLKKSKSPLKKHKNRQMVFTKSVCPIFILAILNYKVLISINQKNLK